MDTTKTNPAQGVTLTMRCVEVGNPSPDLFTVKLKRQTGVTATANDLFYLNEMDAPLALGFDYRVTIEREA